MGATRSANGEALTARAERALEQLRMSRAVMAASTRVLASTLDAVQASVSNLHTDYSRGRSMRSESQWLRGTSTSQRTDSEHE